MTPNPAPSVPLTISEEVAIYTALFDQLGIEDRTRIEHQTNRGGYYLREGTKLDCDRLQAWLLDALPDIIPEIIPAFCAINAVQHPIRPEVLRLIGINTDITKGGISVSAVQTDMLKRQALVFIIIGGDYLQTTYVLLTQRNGVWTVEDKEP